MKIDGRLPPAKGRATGRAGSSSNSVGMARVTAAESLSPAASVSILGIPQEELTERVQAAIQGLLAELESLRRELAGTRERVGVLERLADEDTLVPVPNRRGFLRELDRASAYARRYGVPASLIYFDLNNFKMINDRFGHAAGDEALLAVGRILVAHVRASDIVGRIGGDEFAVLLLQAGPELAEEKAASLAAAIRSEPLVFEGESISLSLAYGVSSLSIADSRAALAAADRAMYSHKRDAKAGRPA